LKTVFCDGENNPITNKSPPSMSNGQIQMIPNPKVAIIIMIAIIINKMPIQKACRFINNSLLC
jgi:hypothetical protein